MRVICPTQAERTFIHNDADLRTISANMVGRLNSKGLCSTNSTPHSGGAFASGNFTPIIRTQQKSEEDDRQKLDIDHHIKIMDWFRLEEK